MFLTNNAIFYIDVIDDSKSMSSRVVASSFSDAFSLCVGVNYSIFEKVWAYSKFTDPILYSMQLRGYGWAVPDYQRTGLPFVRLPLQSILCTLQCFEVKLCF